MQPLTRLILSTFVLLLAGACNPAIHISGETTVNPLLQKDDFADLAKMLNRQVEPAKDILVSATLWDLSYIVAFQEARTTRKEQTAELAKANIEAWRKRFIVGQTSFRVRVELLNRGTVIAGDDKILNLKQWTWKLKRSDGKVIPYKFIHVELSKRYKDRETGLYSYRLDGTVHFPGRPHPVPHRWIELWAHPPGDRPAVKMRWNLKKP